MLLGKIEPVHRNSSGAEKDANDAAAEDVNSLRPCFVYTRSDFGDLNYPPIETQQDDVCSCKCEQVGKFLSSAC